MIQFVLAAALQAAVMTGANVTKDYAQAYESTHETGKPLVVLVGADWCPGCRTMKQSVMPQVARNGALDKVSYAEVNTDHDGKLARELMDRGAIPQLVVYHQTSDGWNRQVFVGVRSVSEIERIITEAVDETAAKKPAMQQTATN